MSFPDDQVAELKKLCEGVALCEEAGTQYLLLQGLTLPSGCSPAKVDALFRSSGGSEGYPSRLFFAEQVKSPFARNWNFNGRLCNRNWFAHSWRVAPGQRLAQTVLCHLDGFRRAE